MWRHLPVLFAVLVLTTAAPKPYYQQHYEYQEQSESYKNNELQHKKEEAGRYSKIDDGVSKPLERKAFHHSEYRAPGSESQSYSSLHGQNGGLAIPDLTNQHLSQGYHSGDARFLQSGSQTVQPVPTSYRREWSSQSSYSTGQSSIPSTGFSQPVSNGYSDSAVSGSSVSQSASQHKEERLRSYTSHDQNQGRGYGNRPTSANLGTISDDTSGRISDQRSHSYFNAGTNTNRQYTTDEEPGLVVYPATKTERKTQQTSRSYSSSQTGGTPAVYSVPQNSGIILVPASQTNVPSGTTTGTAQSRRTYSTFQSGSHDDSQSGVRIVPASQIIDSTPQRIIPVDQLHSGTTRQTSRQYTASSTNLKSYNTDDDDTQHVYPTSGTDRNAQSRRTYFVSGTTNPDGSLRPVGTQTNPTLPATSGTNVVTHQARTNQQTSRSYTISQPTGTVPQDYRPSRGPVPYPGFRALTTESPIEPEEPNTQISTADQTSENHSSRRVFHAASHVRVNPTNTEQRPQQNEDYDLTRKSLDTDITQQTHNSFDNDDLTQQRRRPNVNQNSSYTSRQSQRTYQERTENQNSPQYTPISNRPVSDSQTHRSSQRTYKSRTEKTEFADVPSTVKPDQTRVRLQTYPTQQSQTFDNVDQQSNYDQTVQYSQTQNNYDQAQRRDYSQHADNQDLSQRTDTTARLPSPDSNQGSSYSSSSSYSKSSSYSTQQQQQPQVVFSPVHVGTDGGKLQVYQTMQIPAGTSEEVRRQMEEQMRQQLELKMQELYSQQSSSYSSSSQPRFSPLNVGRTGSGQLQVYQTVAIPAGATEETRQRLQQEMRQNLEMKMRELMQQQGYANIRHISTQPGQHIHTTGDGVSADCDEQTGGSYSTSYSMSSSSSSSSSSTGGGGNHYSMKLRPGSTYAIHQPVGTNSYYRTQY